MFILNKKKSVDDSNAIPMTKIKVVEIKEHTYVLCSLEYNKMFEMIILFYSVKELSVGDVLELPYNMLRMDEGYPLFSNHMLCFGKPDEKIAIPKDFDIRQDYAYLTYAETKKKIMVQRYYG